MEYNSFFRLNFFSNIDDMEKHNTSIDVLCSILVNVNCSKSVNDAFEYIYSNSNSKAFTITLQTDKKKENSIAPKSIDKIFLILSHAYYYQYFSKKVIGLFFGNSDYTEQALFRQLMLELSKQGFDLLTINFSSKIPPNIPFYFLDNITDEEKLYNWSLSKLRENSATLEIFYNKMSYQNRDGIIKIFERIEKKINTESPLLYELLQTKVFYSLKLKEKDGLIRSLERDLSSKDEYISGFWETSNPDSNQIDIIQSMKIKRFYNQEYEILPLWYKRFGHIIKVIMGKRTFRSLFSDKVKKYKD